MPAECKRAALHIRIRVQARCVAHSFYQSTSCTYQSTNALRCRNQSASALRSMNIIQIRVQTHRAVHKRFSALRRTMISECSECKRVALQILECKRACAANIRMHCKGSALRCTYQPRVQAYCVANIISESKPDALHTSECNTIMPCTCQSASAMPCTYQSVSCIHQSANALHCRLNIRVQTRRTADTRLQARCAAHIRVQAHCAAPSRVSVCCAAHNI